MTEEPQPAAEPAGPGIALVWELLAPAAVGVATGACVAALVGGVETWALDVLASLPYPVPALFAPLAFLLTWLTARYVTGAESPSTSELYITTYNRPGGRVPLGQLPGRVLATTATVGLGGSQGFESTSALIGAAWSDVLGRGPVAVPERTRRALLAAGASAGIAAVFSSPGAGALYGIEVPFKRDVDAPRLAPCVVAAVCAFVTRAWLIGVQRIVPVEGVPPLDGMFFLGCVLVAVLCGLGARLYARITEGLHAVGRRQTRLTRALLGGGVLVLLAAAGYSLCGAWITFGSGYVAAGWLLAGSHPVELIVLALLVRAGGNLVSVYAGGGGGLFTSLACNGALIGEGVARLLGCDATHTLALLGAACFLGSGYRLPLACMLFVAEGSASLPVIATGLIAVAVGQVLMGDESVSDAQAEERRPAADQAQ